MIEFNGLNAAVLGAFGESVSYTHDGSGTVETVTGVWHRPTADDPGPIAPVLFVALADLSEAPASGDSVTYDSREWRVCQVHEDNAGGVRLVLQEIHT